MSWRVKCLAERERRRPWGFFTVARRDFEAAKFLMEHGLYPQALFMLQQSLEKVAKAVLLALNLASIDDLKREVRHEILTRGLRLLLSETADELVYGVAYAFMARLPLFVKVLCACSSALHHFSDLMREGVKVAQRLKQLAGEESVRRIKKLTGIGRKALDRASDEVLKEIDNTVDRYSQYLAEPLLLVEEAGIETMFSKMRSFLDSLRTCITRNVKDRNRRAEILRAVEKYLYVDRGRVRENYVLTRCLLVRDRASRTIRD